jgi:cysteine-rich repeat protein
MPRALRAALLLAVAAPVSSLGCVGTFDPALFQRDAGADAGEAADAAPDDAGADAAIAPDAAPDDAGTDGGSFDGGPPVLALADYCSAAVPELTLPMGASATSIGIDTRSLADDVSMDVAACVRGSPTGPEGFAMVRMAADERWHFHFRHVGDANPALYVLPSCDPRVCRDDQSINLCDQGADEHLTFQAPAAGEYLVGLDTFDAVGLTGTLEVIRPTCGNGAREHSETCDDSNLTPGDGCDEECRDEITPAPTDRGETEVNDDRFSANHVLPSGTTPLLVTGRIASSCESDWFVVDLASDGSISAVLGTMAGASCTGSADVPDPFRLDLLAADGLTVLGSGTDSAGCPGIDPARDAFAAGLPAGRYFLRVFGRVETGRTFNYGLRVTLAAP